MNKICKLSLLFFFIIFICVFTSWHIGKEINIYRCDFIQYNLYYYDYAKLFISDCNAFLHNIYYEIYHYGRNPFLIIFLIPFFFIFKESRAGFIIAVNLVFMLPCMILLYKIVNNFIIEHRKKSIIYYLMIFSIIFMFPPLWMASLSGIPDICGMVPVLGAFYLYFNFGCNKNTPLKYIILTAVFLYISFLMRRWYSVVIVCFLVSVILENFIQSFEKPFKIKKIFIDNIFTLKNIFIISIIITGLAYLIQFGYVSNIFEFEGRERGIYSFPLNQWEIIFFEILGIVYFILSLIGAVFNIKNKYVRFAFINLVLYISAFIIGMNNQFLWINHYLFVACMLIILICSALNTISNKIKINYIRNIVMLLIIIYSILNFVICFEFPLANKFSYMFSKNYYYVDNSANYPIVKEIYDFLEKEYQKNKNIKVAQFGLNNSFGYFQLRGINPKSDFIKNNYVYDLVFDCYFNASEINADYIINMTPLDFFFKDKSLARVLCITNKMFETNSGIAKNYKKIKEYNLKDGTKLSIYKRTKLLSKKQIKE